MKDNNRKYVGTFLPSEIHSALISYATKMGKDPSEVASALIEEGLEQSIQYALGTQDAHSPALDLAAAYLGVRRRESMRHQLVCCCISILQGNSSDERFVDQTERMALENGFSFDDAMRDAELMARVSSSSTYILTAPDNVGIACTFLASLFKDRVSIPVNEILLVAERREIPVASLKEAKRKLAIVSRRIGIQWFWEIQYQQAPVLVENKV